MFTDLKPYATYVDSGIQWFGRLPVGWETSRLRGVSRLLVSNVDKLTHEDEKPVRLCNYVDVYKNEFITDRPGYMTASASDDEIRRFRVRVDDVAITKDSESWTDIGVPAYVAQEADDLVCGYHLGLLRTQKERLSGAYLFRALQVPAIATQFHVAAGGVTRYGLAQDDIRSASVPIPSLNEQAVIVKYLGHANARIDRAIAAKRKLIVLLEEQKQVVINQAVTRGLDPTVPLKDSGIPWLGEIPDHWQVWPIGRLARVGNGSTPSRTTPEFWQDGNYPWLNSSFANKREVLEADQFVTTRALAECHLPIVPPGSVIVAITGQGKTRGKAAFLKMEATINQHLAYLTPDPRRLIGLFLQAVLVAAYPELRRISDDSGSTKGALTCQDVKVFRVPVPPLVEQTQIVQWIHDETHTTEAAADRAAREIELLREFRTRLTADVVTGQLDIRDAAALLPELDPADLVSDVIEQDEDDLEAVLAASLEEVDA
jgi:type I restriction enzyme, S subunit